MKLSTIYSDELVKGYLLGDIDFNDFNETEKQYLPYFHQRLQQVISDSDKHRALAYMVTEIAPEELRSPLASALLRNTARNVILIRQVAIALKIIVNTKDKVAPLHDKYAACLMLKIMIMNNSLWLYERLNNNLSGAKDVYEVLRAFSKDWRTPMKGAAKLKYPYLGKRMHVYISMTPEEQLECLKTDNPSFDIIQRLDHYRYVKKFGKGINVDFKPKGHKHCRFNIPVDNLLIQSEHRGRFRAETEKAFREHETHMLNRCCTMVKPYGDKGLVKDIYELHAITDEFGLNALLIPRWPYVMRTTYFFRGEGYAYLIFIDPVSGEVHSIYDHTGKLTDLTQPVFTLLRDKHNVVLKGTVLKRKIGKDYWSL